MKKILISSLAVAGLLFTVSCNTEFDTDVKDVKVTNGTADFTKYVALGNSLTSGYRDGALYLDGQNESYPSMIAQQMKLAGGGEFSQPLMPNNVGGFTNLFTASGGKDFYGKLTLQVVGGALSPTPSAPATNLDVIGGAGKYFNNMGVPGAKSFHLVAPGYGSAAGLTAGTANPYFVRFATSATTRVIDDAMAQKPTFVSLWIGANDVLSYSTSGGTNYDSGTKTYSEAVDQKGNVNPATYKSSDISDPNVVAGSIKAVLDGLKSANPNVKGVIANIPQVTSIPFFTRVPYNAIPLDAATAQSLNTNLYSKLNAALTYLGQGSRIKSVAAGNNPVLIVDPDLKNLSNELTTVLTAGGATPQQAAFLGQTFGQARQATSDDLILLTASTLLGKDALTGQAPTPTSQFIFGASYPIANQYSLTKNEIAKVKTATDSYNASIASLASSYGYAFVDANAKMIELSQSSGIQFDGVKYTATFVTGGTFSLDGVHLTGRGYAVIANEFIKAINNKYGSTLPMVNPNGYSGVKFP